MPGHPPTSTPPSLWEHTAGADSAENDALTADADVVIVGAGYTGLWTAWALTGADPSQRVVVLDRHHVGFGASGRNGGWCSALLPVSLDALAKRHGHDQAIALQRAMFDTVNDVVEFANASGQPDLAHRGGTISLARTARQLDSLRAEAALMGRFGFGSDDAVILGADDARQRCAATDVVGGMFTPHCAAVQPLLLARAIAADARRRGVRIVEGVDVVSISPRAGGRGPRVVTSAGVVAADSVLLATEGFTAALPGHRRDLLPVYSMMIGSEPLDESTWADLGLSDRETFADARHTVIYGQRTADGRLAFGGRGAPYHFGSRIEPSFDRSAQVRAQLVQTISELFPALAGRTFPFHWGGPLGIPRDWHPFVRFDPATGLGAAGGYVGDGVATARLAGATLADLVRGVATERTALPMVGHRSRPWEPEPARWLGVRLAALAARQADAADVHNRATVGAWNRLFNALT